MKARRGAIMENRIPELRMKLNILGKTSRLFVQRPELAVLLIVILTVLGVSSYALLPKESLPEIVFPSLSIQTVYPGASPIEVEQLVTNKIEGKMSSIEGVDSIASQSNDSFSFVTVTFVEGTDMDRKKIQIDGTLSELKLPDGAFKPTSSLFKTSEIPLISLSLTGDEDIFTLTQLSEKLAVELEKITGVSEVKVFGGVKREVRIVTTPERLSEYGLGFTDLSQAIVAVNISASLGELEAEGQRFSIAINESIQGTDDLKKIPIATRGFGTIMLEDIAEIVDTSQTIRQFSRSHVKGSELNNSVFIQVIRENRQDVIGTSQRVKDKIEESKKTLLPEGVEVIISRDTAIQVQDDLSNIQSNALSGLLVVILVLFLFIGFRESLIVSITIPLTLLATLGVLNFFKITLNTFAILGLIVALGLLVDNTIIVMENMVRLSKKGIEPRLASVYGTNQVAYPIAAATLTTVAAFFPLAILPGIIGAFINTIPRTIIITLLSSLIIAITITPAVYYLVYRGLGRKQKTPSKKWILVSKILKVMMVATLSVWAFYGEDVWLGVPIIATSFFVAATVIKEFFMSKKSMKENRFVRSYQNVIRGIVQSKLKMASVLLIAILLLGSTALLFTSGSLKIAFFPSTEPTSLSIDVDVAGGLTLERTAEIVGQVEEILINSKDVEKFSSTIGGNEIDRATINLDFTSGGDNGFVKLDRLRADLDVITEAQITIQANAAAGPPVGQPIGIKIRGNDLDANKKIVDAYSEVLSSLPGVYNIEQSVNEGSKKVVMDIDLAEAAAIGLSPSYIAFQVRNLIEGLVATTFVDNASTVDVRIVLEEESLKDLEKAQIKTPIGEIVELSSVISLREEISVSGIQREDQVRTITLTADLENGYNASETITLFQERIAVISIPETTLIDYGGESANIAENFGSLFTSMFLAIMLVFVILTIQFGSIKQPIAIISTVPMAVIGVLYGLVITGNEFGFYAFMALVALVGIAVNDAIVLIDYMNYLRSEKMSFYDAIAEAGRTRLNPVLATTLTTIGGILPLSYKSAYYAQFGYALIFGLMVTTLMTLVLIPIMYALLEGRATRREEKARKKDRILVTS